MKKPSAKSSRSSHISKPSSTIRGLKLNLDKAKLLTALKEGLVAQQLNLSEETQDKLIDYIELLHKWNGIHNLTAITDPFEMIQKHILDSLSVYPFLKESLAKTILDVGTGAGLPGIVLALSCPDRHFVLIDSQQKKINFVQHVVLSLKLENVSLICKRVEDYQPKQLFDWVISRAYASLSEFVQTTEHLCQTEGRFIAMKGKISLEEQQDLPASFRLERCENLEIPGLSAARSLLFIKKESLRD